MLVFGFRKTLHNFTRPIYVYIHNHSVNEINHVDRSSSNIARLKKLPGLPFFKNADIGTVVDGIACYGLETKIFLKTKKNKGRRRES